MVQMMNVFVVATMCMVISCIKIVHAANVKKKNGMGGSSPFAMYSGQSSAGGGMGLQIYNQQTQNTNAGMYNNQQISQAQRQVNTLQNNIQTLTQQQTTLIDKNNKMNTSIKVLGQKQVQLNETNTELYKTQNLLKKETTESQKQLQYLKTQANQMIEEQKVKMAQAKNAKKEFDTLTNALSQRVAEMNNLDERLKSYNGTAIKLQKQNNEMISNMQTNSVHEGFRHSSFLLTMAQKQQADATTKQQCSALQQDLAVKIFSTWEILNGQSKGACMKANFNQLLENVCTMKQNLLAYKELNGSYHFRKFICPSDSPKWYKHDTMPSFSASQEPVTEDVYYENIVRALKPGGLLPSSMKALFSAVIQKYDIQEAATVSQSIQKWLGDINLCRPSLIQRKHGIPSLCQLYSPWQLNLERVYSIVKQANRCHAQSNKNCQFTGTFALIQQEGQEKGTQQRRRLLRSMDGASGLAKVPLRKQYLCTKPVTLYDSCDTNSRNVLKSLTKVNGYFVKNIVESNVQSVNVPKSCIVKVYGATNTTLIHGPSTICLNGIMENVAAIEIADDADVSVISKDLDDLEDLLKKKADAKDLKAMNITLKRQVALSKLLAAAPSVSMGATFDLNIDSNYSSTNKDLCSTYGDTPIQTAEWKTTFCGKRFLDITSLNYIEVKIDCDFNFILKGHSDLYKFEVINTCKSLFGGGNVNLISNSGQVRVLMDCYSNKEYCMYGIQNCDKHSFIPGTQIKVRMHYDRNNCCGDTNDAALCKQRGCTLEGVKNPSNGKPVEYDVAIKGVTATITPTHRTKGEGCGATISLLQMSRRNGLIYGKAQGARTGT
jgi:hypothetical protein